MSAIQKIKSAFSFGPLRVGQGYSGAGVMRRLKNWVTSSGSPDGEILHDLPTLRERSRDLYKNNPIGRGAIKVLINNVVGRGLKMQAAIERGVIAAHNGWTDEESTPFFNQFEQKVERSFSWFAESTECDARGQMNFYELTNLVLNSVLQSGEVFATLPIRQHNRAPYRLRIGLIEADQVQSPWAQFDSRTMRDGIETTPDGTPLAYHININQEVYPYEFARVPKHGPVSGRPLVLHLFKADRPGQSRGVPFLAPIFEIIKSIDSYTKSEIDAALVSSFFTAVIKSDNPNALDSNGIVGASGAQTAEAIEAEGEDFNMGPAAIMQLLPGEDITSLNPTRPNPNYEGFIRTLLQEIGMALGIPFEMLLRHFTASYSASRAARVEFEKEIRIWREWLEFRFCHPIYEEWFTEEVLSGRIDAPGFFDSYEVRKAYLGSVWFGEAMGQIDPLKEIQASQLAVEQGFSTRTEESQALKGNDYLTNITILQREKEARNRLGLVEPDEAAQVAPNVGPGDEAEEAEVEEAEVEEIEEEEATI